MHYDNCATELIRIDQERSSLKSASGSESGPGTDDKSMFDILFSHAQERSIPGSRSHLGQAQKQKKMLCGAVMQLYILELPATTKHDKYGLPDIKMEVLT